MDSENTYGGSGRWTSSEGLEVDDEVNVGGEDEEGGGGTSTLVYIMESIVTPRMHPPSLGFLSIIRMAS